MKMKRNPVMWMAAAGALIAVVGFSAAGCSSHYNGNAAESSAQQAGTNLLEQNQPLPIFPTSQYRYETIEVEAIQALGSPTTSFFFPPGMGPGIPGSKPFKVCASQGEPIPNTTSLSNPLQPYQGNVTTDGSDVVDQMDPNGTYAPTSSSGTYVLCLTASGSVKMTYWEGDVFAESGDAVWDATTASVQDIGPSELPVCIIETAQDGDGTGAKPGTRYYHCVKAPPAPSAK